MSDTFLVTGGTGFIGAHTVRALADRGFDVVATSHRGGEVPAVLRDVADRVRVERVDVSDRDALAALGRRYRLAGIVHLTMADRSGPAAQQAFRTDVAAVLAVTDAARDWGVHRTVLASSLGVYAGTPGPAWTEDTPLPPTTPIDLMAAKRIAELVAGAAAGLDVVCARVSTIWGPLHRRTAPVMPRLVRAALDGTGVRIDAGDEPLYADDGRDLCYVKDCAEGLALLATADGLAHRIYNVGDGRPTRPADVAAALGALLGRPPTPLPPGRDPAGPDHDTWLDVTRLADETGYRPAWGLDRGLPDYVDWLRAGHPH
jgi:UDP-glucose 4-epimerase